MPAQNQFRVIIGSYEHNIMCLSLNLDKETPLFTPIFHFQAHSLSVKCMDINQRYLVSGSNDEHIRIYDLQKRKELGTLLAHQGSITGLKFSKTEDNKSKWLFSSSDDKNIIIWRVKDWENFGILKGHMNRINDFDIHPSNRIAVSVSEDHTIRLWNLMTVKKAAVLKLKKYSQNGQFVRWFNNGEYFAVALLNKVLVYKTSTAKVHCEIDMGKKTIMHMESEIIKDNKEYLCIGMSDGNVHFYYTEKLFNLETDENDDEEISGQKFEPEFSLLGHSNRVKDFRFYSNEFSKYLVTISSDGKIVVWDMKTTDQVAVYDVGERLNCLAVCDESIEKTDTMKKRATDSTIENDLQSEYETDTEELKKVMFGKDKKKKKNSKKNANKRRKVTVEYEK
ncbi:hypothetical protein TBLA_0C00990 [Henningerozyma blattae CBS 6284]|uniref:Anaphase-promoting complex subunit 4 WD40 domain-containing protein n=1 Tax=Henningerozyma blattae (strain ATCC 34711 / CBS 6284 / DSM 70876 / NBRC 10599 / NRRL Y-10934 / UCD 77-7) TaxID=1071380 RepID=I2H0L2_HENB6|nr:hypothetical protein TBLA_0C00990 [Tetrapisispora blattae CBS 6284]CCH59914.1 hypothetical protein TBLA_0C00990 [Tetrapisispora blattae CBS 6284]